MTTESRLDVTEYRPFPNEEGRNSRQTQLEIPVLVRTLGLPTDVRILEVGCGRGIALPVLDRLCSPRRLAGLDIDEELLVEAADNLRECGTQAELYRGDVRRMPFADEAFDVIIDFGTLYHIARSPAALDEIARVLAPAGTFVYETKARSSFAPRSFPRPSSTATGNPWPAAPALGDALGFPHQGVSGLRV